MTRDPILLKLYKTLRQPRRAWRYALTVGADRLTWGSRFGSLRQPKVLGEVAHDPVVQLAVERELEALGFHPERIRIDVADYDNYLRRARYQRFPTYYYGGRAADFPEKAIEHYLAAKLLDLQPDDVYVDVASYDSPTPAIYRDLFGCTTYRQDLAYPVGVRGDKIGGDAARMPVAGGFVSKMGLHNSFEHFEGDSDMRFIEEAGRVLRPGGRMCIVPLFLSDRYAIQTDPVVLPRGGIPFEADAVLYCARGWRNRHGRFYDPPHLVSRIRDHLGSLRMRVLVVENERELDPGCYVKFIGLFEKPI